MLWAITGGAGFLGLHLSRRLLARGDSVRTLDLAPLADEGLEREVEEVRGDVRDPARAHELVRGAADRHITRSPATAIRRSARGAVGRDHALSPWVVLVRRG